MGAGLGLCSTEKLTAQDHLREDGENTEQGHAEGERNQRRGKKKIPDDYTWIVPETKRNK